MSQNSFVFLDVKGRRWTFVRWVVALSTIVLLTLLVIFIRALWVKPELHMPGSLQQMKMQLKGLAKISARASKANEPPWKRFEQPPVTTPRKKSAPNKPAQPHIAAAILSSADSRSLESLVKHADDLTHICPDMFVVSGQPADLRIEVDPDALNEIKATKLLLVPMLTNLVGAKWDTDAVEGLLQADEPAQDAFIGKLISGLQNVNAAGVLIDWQGIDPTLSPKLVEFIARIHQALQNNNMQLWLSIPVGDDLRAFDLDKLPEVVDKLVAQLHDENAEDDVAGPVASQPWFEGWLRTLMGYGDPSQWILSLGSYGYDWNKGTGKVETISFADAMARAQRSSVDPVTSSSPDFNPGFAYDLEEQSHEVWFLDATTFANQLQTVEEEGCAGIVLNRLGTEDPGVWAVLDRHFSLPNDSLLKQLDTIDPKSVIAQIGEGDFLRAELESVPGKRTVWLDNDKYVCETYQTWPTYPTVIHLGEGKPDQVALTFDDGPDPEWTPKVLEILREHNVKATFFVLGKHAEQYPWLIRDILKDGHEIGSHTYTHPNLSEASTEQVTVELNATQRLIEWLTGRTTILFRPPYNADAMPASYSDAVPIARATEMGYITVGESVDPQDWDKPGTEEIFKRIREQRSGGSVILLHDAGGDRTQTVAALPRILDFLQARGDSIVTAGELLGLTRDETMPPVADSAKSAPTVITNYGLFVIHWAEEFLWAFMIVTSLLTLVRSFMLALFAIRRKNPPVAENFAPDLSIIIAAYNEGKVITQTLSSLLKTEYKGGVEIVVVDDGSSDDTAARAESLGDPRVRVIRQANSGKAGALAGGLAAAKNDVVVFLDADTQFQPDTLHHLVNPLSNPKVGAVSGHARVGNLNTWIARFQGLEYICGFNLDRRAYDVINAVTVVPGAISAFRKSAIQDAGGFALDTLAEDTDLTLSLHRAGWVIAYAPDAIAWTEAPESVRTLAKQRFRWAFGTMQCLWKHRDLILSPRYGWLGCFSLPSVVLFQIVLVAAIPIVDFLLIISLLTGAGLPFVAYFSAFLLCDLALALVACWIEEEPLSRAFWIIPMRFVYRPILSFVVWKSLIQISRGALVGWGKLERRGTVAMPPSES